MQPDWTVPLDDMLTERLLCGGKAQWMDIRIVAGLARCASLCQRCYTAHGWAPVDRLLAARVRQGEVGRSDESGSEVYLVCTRLASPRAWGLLLTAPLLRVSRMLRVGIEREGVHHIGGVYQPVFVHVQGGTHSESPF